MESENSSLLNVPITDAERRAQQSSHLRGESSHTLIATFSEHERDRQFDPRLGRFSSLRHPSERYDDPEQPYQNYSGTTTRPSTLPGIEEESHYSDHDDEEPIVQPTRSSTFPRSKQAEYAALPNPHEHEPVQKSYGEPPKFWQPIWLRRVSLILTVVLLLLLIVALVVTCNNVETNDGYHISAGTSHYLWTHIPTLIIVLVVILWRQIDYHVKELMPWQALAMGPESPFDSLLVDYISVFQIVSFLAAFKRLHVPVLITITGFVISLGVAIASTGLFFSQLKDFRDNFPTVLTTSFDAAALDPAIFNTNSFPNSSVYAYVQSVVNGLGPQLGVGSGFAYLMPVLRSQSKAVPPNSTFTATMDTFVPSISCRAANVTLSGETTIETEDFPYNSTDTPYGAPSNLTMIINESDICDSWPALTFRGLDPLHYIVPGQTLESRSEEVYCDGDKNADPILLLTLVEVTYEQDLLTNVTREEGGELPIALTTSRSVSRMVNVLCQADYTVSQVNVTNNTALDGQAAMSLTRVPNPANKILDGLTPANMTTIFSTLLGSDHGLFTDTQDENFMRTPAFDLLAWTAGTGSYDDLFDANTLANSSQQLYIGTMSEFASKNLVSTIPNNTAPNGPVASILWREERLFTNWTPVIITITGLGLMALLASALILLVPKNVVPRNPNSIAAAATFLSRSHELNRLLRKLQSPQNKGIAAALNGYDVGTAIALDEGTGARSFKVHITEGKPQRDVEEIKPDVKFWNPIWAGLPVLAFTFTVPLVLLALLEIFYDRSQKNNGLWTVPDDRGTLIASHFIPAFIALLVAALINNLDFYITLLAPWSRLFKTNALAGHSILKNVLGHIAPSAALIAIKAQYWGALASTLATVFAGLLTIVISGLYVIQDFDTDGPTRGLSRQDNFDLNLIRAYSVDNDNGAGAMLDLIQQNFSFPAGTYDEYALPRVSLLDLDNPVLSGSRLVGEMRGTLPGYRGNITCEAPTSVSMSTADSTVRVSATYDISEACMNGIDSLSSRTLNFSTDFTLTQGGLDFGGKQFDLRFGTNSSEYGYLGEDNSTLVADNPAVGCPSLAFIWGRFALGTDNTSTVNVAICTQKIQTIDVNVNMQLDTTQIGPGRMAAVGDEDSAESLTNPNSTTDVFDFRIQNNIARQLGDFPSNSNIDPFFSSMINGSIVMDVDRFVSNRTLAIMGISHTYRLYMAQVFNAMLREPVTTSNSLHRRQQSDLNLRTTMTTSRLVQDKLSTILLQVLCGLSSILIMVAYVLTKMRNVLPCNPCSIAGTMSLLAGSDLCYSPDDGICECCGKVRRSFRDANGRVQVETIHADENEHAEDDRTQSIRQGAEWMDDQTFARIFTGRTYSLGWWEPRHKVKRYGVDVGSSPSGGQAGEWYLGKRKNSETFEIFSEQAQTEGRGRSRALSDVNERGAYQRAADPSPGVEAHEMRPMGSGGLSERDRHDEA